MIMAAFLAAVDVVTVATPAVHHAGAALAALKAGKPVYSEKPLAVTPDDADRMVAVAAWAGLPLACGHQERVVFQAMSAVRASAPVTVRNTAPITRKPVRP